MRKRGMVATAGVAGVALVTALSVSLKAPDTADARKYECKRGPQFAKKPKKGFKRTEPAQRNENTSSTGTVKVTFTSKKTRSVKTQLDAGGEVSVDAVFASAKASFNYSIAKEATAEIGNSISTKVKPRTYVLGRYGLYTYKFEGGYYGVGGDGRPATPGCRFRLQYPITVVFPRESAGWKISRGRIRN